MKWNEKNYGFEQIDLYSVRSSCAKNVLETKRRHIHTHTPLINDHSKGGGTQRPWANDRKKNGEREKKKLKICDGIALDERCG